MELRLETMESSIQNIDLDAAAETLTLLNNEEVFNNFYLKTVRPFWSYLARVCGNSALADDLVQESYLRLLSANAPWRAGDEACRRYLFRIGTNLMRDHWRRPTATSLQDVPEPLLPSVDPISMESMDSLGSNAQLHTAMMHLRPVERQLLWLAHAEDLSYREISDITGLSVARIRLTLFRSRHKLARAVRQEIVKSEVRS
jgi:RNA polymerase sigma-70 factor, ECF subfamily